MLPVLPRLETPRLVLRACDAADAPRVQQLAGDPRIAATTLNIPHPYLDGMAETWIAGHAENFARRQRLELAIVRRDDDLLIGAAGLVLAMAHARAEMGYWIGHPYWGQGYCTEAAGAMIAYGFDELRLHRIQARHLAGNPASGRVMEKLGMRREGVMRDQVRKDDAFHDMVMRAILAGEHRGAAGDVSW